MANSIKSTELLNTFLGSNSYPIEKDQRITVRRSDLDELNSEINTLLMYDKDGDTISLGEIIKKVKITEDGLHNIKLCDIEDVCTIQIDPKTDLSAVDTIIYDINDQKYKDQGRGFGKITQTIKLTGATDNDGNAIPLVRDKVAIDITDYYNDEAIPTEPFTFDLTKENADDPAPTYLGTKEVSISVNIKPEHEFPLTSDELRYNADAESGKQFSATYSAPTNYVGTKKVIIYPQLDELTIESLEEATEDSKQSIFVPTDTNIGFNKITVPKVKDILTPDIDLHTIFEPEEPELNNIFINSTNSGADTVVKEVILTLVGTAKESTKGAFSNLTNNEIVSDENTFTFTDLDNKTYVGTDAFIANTGDTVKVIFETTITGTDELGNPVEEIMEDSSYYYFNGFNWTECVEYIPNQVNSAIVTLANQEAGIIFSSNSVTSTRYDSFNEQLAGYKSVEINIPGSYNYLYTQPQNLIRNVSAENEASCLTFNFNDPDNTLNTLVIPKLDANIKHITSQELEDAFKSGKAFLSYSPTYTEADLEYSEGSKATVQVPQVFNGITIDLPTVILATDSSQDLSIVKTITKNAIDNTSTGITVNTNIAGDASKTGEVITTDSINNLQEDAILYTTENTTLQLINKTKSNNYTITVDRPNACVVNVYQLDKANSTLYSTNSKLFSFSYPGQRFDSTTNSFINPDKYIISFTDDLNISYKTTSIVNNETGIASDVVELSVNNIEVNIVAGDTNQTTKLTPEEIASLFNITEETNAVQLTNKINLLVIECINNIETTTFDLDSDTDTISINGSNYAVVATSDTQPRAFTKADLAGALIWVDSANNWSYSPEGVLAGISANGYQNYEYTSITDGWWKLKVENNGYVELPDNLEYTERYFNVYKGSDTDNINDHFKIYIPTSLNLDFMQDENVEKIRIPDEITGEYTEYASLPLSFIDGYFNINSNSVVIDNIITAATVKTDNNELVLDTITINGITHNVCKADNTANAITNELYTYVYADEIEGETDTYIGQVEFLDTQIIADLIFKDETKTITTYYEKLGNNFILYFNGSDTFTLTYDSADNLVLSYNGADYQLRKHVDASSLNGIYQTITDDVLSFEHLENVSAGQTITVSLDNNITATLQIEEVENDQIKTFYYNDLIYTVQSYNAGSYSALATSTFTNIIVANNKIYVNPLSIIYNEVNN